MNMRAIRNIGRRLRGIWRGAASRRLPTPLGTIRRLDCLEYEDRVLFSATPADGEVLVNTETSSTQSVTTVAQQAVAADPTGSFVVAWTSDSQDGNGTGVYAQRFDASGNKLGAEFQVNTTILGDQAEAAVAKAADGSFVIAWSGPILDVFGITILGEGVYYQWYNAAGVAVGGEQQTALALLEDFSEPSIAMNSATGDFVISWTRAGGDLSGDAVYARQFQADGTPDGGAFRVNSTTASDQNQSSVAFDGAGNFIVSWTSAGQDGSGTGVYAKWYDASGAVISAEFRVNTTTAGNQSEVSVAADGTGNFLVTWSSQGQDGSGLGVYGQRYDSAGAQVGGEFLVNVTTAGDQSESRVAMDSAGGFTVAWTSNGQDAAASDGIYFRQYDNTGAAISPETLVNRTVAGTQQTPSVVLQDSGAIVVAWSGSGPGDADGVFLQRYVDGANSAPLNTVPGTQSTVEDTPLLLGTGTSNAISVADSSTAMNPIRVTLTATSGTVTLAGLTGLTFTAGDGTADAVMTFTGRIADINAALDGLTFAPTLDFAGTAALAISTNDLGYSGTGGAQTTSTSITINVTPVNDQTPTISSNGGGLTANVSVAENTTLVTTVVGVDADLPTPTLTYSIIGGADAGLFTIDATTGALSFLAPPDFETPGDSDGDNVYQVIVQASDGTFFESQTIVATVTDVSDTPTPTPSSGGSGGGGAGGGTGGGGSSSPIYPSPWPAPGGTTDDTPSSPTQEPVQETSETTTPPSVQMPGDTSGGVIVSLFGDERHGSVDAVLGLAGFDRSLGFRTATGLGLGAGDGFGASDSDRVDWGRGSDRSAKGTAVVRTAASTRAGGAVRDIAGATAEEPAIPWPAIDAVIAESDYTTTEYLVVGTAGLTATLTVGYLVWTLQAGSLTSILLSSLPTWKSFDPLPVLEYERRRKNRAPDVDELDGVFDPLPLGTATGGALGAR